MIIDKAPEKQDAHNVCGCVFLSLRTEYLLIVSQEAGREAAETFSSYSEAAVETRVKFAEVFSRKVR